MRIAIFGLTVSSSWGNGHATLWRGLIRSLIRAGHKVTFFERDLPYYAANRDLHRLPEGGALVLYDNFDEVRERAAAEVRAADASIVTSYCPDGVAASRLVLEEAAGIRVFYDLDTPVTLARLAAGEEVSYLPPEGLGGFDLVLSYTGGQALHALRAKLGARRVAPLYGHADPAHHWPAPPRDIFTGDLSYLGTYAVDRQPVLERLFIDPARRRADRRFVLAGAGYPEDFPWSDNIAFVRHLAPPDHPGFYCSSRLTLNLTRAEMAGMGYCPSGRLFEAAACGTAVLSDYWPGLESFFTPGEEILIAEDAEDVLAALDLPDAEITRIAAAARARLLDEHSASRRAGELLDLLSGGASETPQVTQGEISCGA